MSTAEAADPRPSTLRDYFATLLHLTSWRLAKALALMLLISLTESVSLLMLIPLLQLVGLEVGGGEIGRLSFFVARGFGLFHLKPTLVAVLLFYVGLISAQALLYRWQRVVTFSLAEGFMAELRKRLYGALVGSSWLFFARSRGSDFFNVLTNQLERMGSATGSLLGLLVEAVVTAVYIALALFLSPEMTLLLLVCGGLLMLLLRHKSLVARKKGEAISREDETLYAAISEHLAGMKLTKSHGVEADHRASFAAQSDRVARAYIAAVRHYGNVDVWMRIGGVVVLSLSLYLALEVLHLPAASILLLLYVFSRMLPRFNSLQSSYQRLRSALPAFDRIRKMEARCLAAAEPPGGTVQRVTLEHELRFEGVGFRYEDRAAPVLDDLCLDIAARKTTAVVGPSGAGKSTLADLAVGLFPPSEGAILLDGEPLTAVSKNAWRGRIGYVAQDAFLFHDTVRANLLLTCPEAGEAMLWGALRAAAADSFVATLPAGLETVLGDRGVTLSGGERQRLSLARALLRQPTLLVLDEATSALDSENERQVQRAIEALRGQVTILVIAHRLSTIRQADVIYVLEQGRVVEAGSWDELISRGGRFHALCVAQGLAGKPAIFNR